ncbi:DEAD/DEAH box helicase [Nocardiopsis sp. RSe5-2]|uniref:DEAD/DEAH box helicase n=1 Tax=Nocardiopsis endophytica TaxID=3018445 RepID=A0ABT4U452_9ACTN|nr:DEAD/DEAH box helicase [Nocardiopsis endophytica]MDA2811739.1 DEAD/DEAH box helicase [Nocardiopsis endophytica]
MRVLHGAWDGADGLVVWAEDAALPPCADGRGTERADRADGPTRQAPPQHPYALSADALGALLTGLGAQRGDPAERRVLLPGSGAHPLPSPALGTLPGAPEVDHPRLHEWRVPCTALRGDRADRALALLDDGPPGDLALGPALRHLLSVRAFALRLAATGRVLPRLVGDPPQAVWRPVLQGADAEHLRALRTALPPSARALDTGAPGAEHANGTDPVYAALCALTDSAARSRSRGARPGGDRAGRHLAAALTRPSPAPLRAPAGTDLPGLAARLRDRHTAAERPSGARLVLRLVEPDPEHREPGAPERWRVEFWVRSAADPSLQLPLSDVWLGAGGAWLPHDVETRLLRELRRASRHFPPIRGALEELAPSAVETGTGGAYAFIRDAAPRLDAAGFAVVLPEGMDGSRLGLRLTVREGEQTGSGGGIGPSDLVDFSFEAVLGGAPVDMAELEELARLKQPLVRLRGRWVEVDPAHLRSALDFLRRRGSGRMRRDEALRAAAAPAGGGAPLPLVGVEADGPLGDLLAGAAEARLEPMDTPADFDGALRPYQRRGAAWLRFLGRLGLGAVLADDMGLGKTVQLLAVLTEERADGAAPGPTLLVCPVSLVGNWVREAARFAPGLRVHAHHGPSRPHGNALARTAGACDLVVTTYGVVTRDADELAALPWHRVVCDEAQAIKNPSTDQARAVRGLEADCRIALTGTPVENNLGELWSIMEFANPGLLGPRASFLRGAARIERGEGEEAERAAGALKRATGPFILRRLKTDRSIIQDLPDKNEFRTWCTLTPEQASLYKAAVEEMTRRLDETDGIQRKGLVLSTMARLKQICNHPAQFLGDGSALAGRSGKLERLEAVLQEALAEGDSALCFTQYAALGDRLAPYLSARLGAPVLWLHGGTPRPRREEMVRRFQEAREPMVFLLSLKAAGTGLTLTAANHVVHIDRWWNPAVEDQATDRAFRIGQRRDVQVRKLVCTGTLEERVDAMIERKKALAERVVGTGEDWLTELSTDELREVVRLAPEAVAR